MFIICMALVFGFFGDLMLRTLPLGLNYPLWLIPLILIIPWKVRRDQEILPYLSKLFLGLALLLSLVPLLRDSIILKFLCICASHLAISLAASTYLDISLANNKFSRFLLNILRAGAGYCFAFILAFTTLNDYSKDLSALLRGVLISIPFIILFGGLFASADVNYQHMLENLIDFDPEWLLTHFAFILLFTWLALGVLALFFLMSADPRNTELNPDEKSAPWSIEIIVVLCAINLIFMSYVYMQLGYLFGGIEYIFETENLTVADYTRRGFFESLIAAGLVLILLLSFDEFLEFNSPSVRKLFTALSLFQIALVLVVIFSAMQRINIYKISFGLTELRFYVYATLIWMIGTFIVLGFTLIKQKHHGKHFLLVSTLWAYACLFGVILINPHAHIAQVNIAHVQAGRDVDVGQYASAYTRPIKKLDARYLAQLSADATPVIIAHLESLPPEDQRHLRAGFQQQLDRYTAQSWKNTCFARSRAQALIEKTDLKTVPPLRDQKNALPQKKKVSKENNQTQGRGRGN